MCGEYLLIGENGAWKMPSKGLTAQRQGSTSVTSLKNCNIPNVTTNTTYLAVLPPVLNIFPVSCMYTRGPANGDRDWREML